MMEWLPPEKLVKRLSEHECSMTISSDSPWFLGHFPEKPIFPGVALLALGMHFCPILALAERYNCLRRVKFKRIIQGGDTIRLSWRKGEREHEGFFCIMSGQELVAEGIVSKEGESPLLSTSDVLTPQLPQTITDAEVLLLHRKPMLLLDKGGLTQAGRFVGEANITAESPFIALSAANAILLLELAAQAAGAIIGAKRQRENEPMKPGFLAGIKRAQIDNTPIRQGAKLIANAGLVVDIGRYLLFEVEIFNQGKRIFCGELQAVRE